ncbi:hypothetical protein Avbf_09032 [Armadillidium vulgare]|nr:hypothetical protein Avbf_09032 [Armadillidium vulgare]
MYVYVNQNVIIVSVIMDIKTEIEIKEEELNDETFKEDIRNAQEEGVEQNEESQKDFKDFQFTTDTSNNDERSYGETSKDVLIGSGMLKEEKEEVEEDKESQEDFKDFGYPTDYLKDGERTHESDDDLSEDLGRKSKCLKERKRNVKNQKRLECPHCDYTTIWHSTLKRHLLNHSEDKNYKLKIEYLKC